MPCPARSSRVRAHRFGFALAMTLVAAGAGIADPGDAPDLKAVAAAAGRVNTLLDERLRADEPATPEFVALRLRWARREAAWTIAAAPDARGRQDAARRYLARAKDTRSGYKPVNRPDPKTAQRIDRAVHEAEAVAQRLAAPDAAATLAVLANLATRDALLDDALETPRRANAPRPEPTDAERKAATEAHAEAVKLVARLRADEPLTPEFVERMCQSSRKVWASQDASEPTPFDRVQAARDHLFRMKTFREKMVALDKAGVESLPVQIAQASYFIHEAELWLAKNAPAQPN